MNPVKIKTATTTKKQQTNNERQIPNIGENAWDNLKFLLITQMTSFDSTSLLQHLLFCRQNSMYICYLTDGNTSSRNFNLI